MEIIKVPFERVVTVEINGTKVKLTPYKERDDNIVKIGVDAPKSIRVNREEIQKQLISSNKLNNKNE